MQELKRSGRAVGDGRPGPLTARIHDLYWRRHEDAAFSTAVPYED